MEKFLSLVEENINYKFKDKKLLLLSLSHPSTNNNNNYYQRLEFLGDKTLSFIIAKELFSFFPNYTESDLTKHHNFLVSKKTMSDIAKKIGIQKVLILSKAEEEQGGREKKSALVDALEALIGAIYLDSGLEKITIFVKKFWNNLLYDKTSHINSDPKSILQELIQKKFKIVPKYDVIDKKGEDHNPEFHIKIQVDKHSTIGIGKSKKHAEEIAAKDFLAKYGKNIGYKPPYKYNN